MFQEDQENQEEPIAAIARDRNQKNRPQGPILIAIFLRDVEFSAQSFLDDISLPPASAVEVLETVLPVGMCLSVHPCIRALTDKAFHLR